MAFHVACPITCKRICFCTHGFPGNLRSGAAKNHFSLDLAQLHHFLTDPLLLRVSQFQVPVPKVSPPPDLPSPDPSAAESTDGVSEDSLSADTDSAPLQRRAAVVAEDLAMRFESAALQGSPRDPAGEEQGLSTVNTMCLLCFTGENEGSERAKTMLSCRNCSKKYHRSCLKTWAKNRDLFHWSSWTCPSCRICEVCSRTDDPTKFKFCRRCDAAYHCYCMQPPHKNVIYGPYLCPNHTRCHSCDSNVPGNGLSVRWFLGYNCCDACGRLFTKGNYCPVCLRVYRDSESTPMVCCDNCQRWVHCQCDSISDEKYLQFQADGNLRYTCATCRGECYQVQDLEDAVRELWRRRDEADRDLIATLRAAAGLPNQEEIFSISPFSDDEDYGLTKVKNEYGRVNLSLKGLPESFPKKSKDSGKKSSKTKKGHLMDLAGKLGSDPNSEDRQDDVPIGYGQNPALDIVLALKRRSPAEGICSINQQGDLKQKYVDEAGNDQKRHGILQRKSKRTNNATAREDANRSVSKQTVKATKLVIHLGGRNINTPISPKSDNSSYQREQTLAVLNGGKVVSQHRKCETLSAERSDSATDHDEGGRFGSFCGLTGVKTREQEGTLIRLGKGKTEQSPEIGLENGTGVNGVFSSEKTPIVLTKRGGSKAAAGKRTSFRKHPGSRTDVHGEVHKTDSQAPPTSYPTLKDSKPLLKLKFKAPFQGSWISHGQEEMGKVKGQRSKRKRPVEKPKPEGDDDRTESEQDNLMDDIMDASWILKKLGKDAIGKRVEVQQLSDNSWHKGVVSNLVKDTSMCSVDLDDGRTKTVELGKHGIRFVWQKKKRPKL